MRKFECRFHFNFSMNSPSPFKTDLVTKTLFWQFVYSSLTFPAFLLFAIGCIYGTTANTGIDDVNLQIARLSRLLPSFSCLRTGNLTINHLQQPWTLFHNAKLSACGESVNLSQHERNDLNFFHVPWWRDFAFRSRLHFVNSDRNNCIVNYEHWSLGLLNFFPTWSKASWWN